MWKHLAAKKAGDDVKKFVKKAQVDPDVAQYERLCAAVNTLWEKLPPPKRKRRLADRDRVLALFHAWLAERRDLRAQEANLWRLSADVAARLFDLKVKS